MPRRDVAAKRYAQAVFGLALETDALDRWQADLAELRMLAGDPAVRAFADTTKVTEAQKFAVLEEALPDVTPQAMNLIKLLVRKHRFGILEQIVDAYDELLNAERGVVVARVTTAVPLTDQARAGVTDAVRRWSGARDVRLEETVESALLGGAIVQVGDRVIDGSVRTRLTGMRRTMSGQMG